jgi:hypothetical protein
MPLQLPPPLPLLLPLLPPLQVLNRVVVAPLLSPMWQTKSPTAIYECKVAVGTMQARICFSEPWPWLR